MIKKIKEWLNRRKENKWKQEYNRGFDWAAGALLRVEITPIGVESYYGTNATAGVSFNRFKTAFDYGAEAATDALVQAGVIKDDGI